MDTCQYNAQFILAWSAPPTFRFQGLCTNWGNVSLVDTSHKSRQLRCNRDTTHIPLMASDTQLTVPPRSSASNSPAPSHISEPSPNLASSLLFRTDSGHASHEDSPGRSPRRLLTDPTLQNTQEVKMRVYKRIIVCCDGYVKLRSAHNQPSSPSLLEPGKMESLSTAQDTQISLWVTIFSAIPRSTLTDAQRLTRTIHREDQRFQPPVPQIVYYQSGIGTEGNIYSEYVEGMQGIFFRMHQVTGSSLSRDNGKFTR
mgnify:FL=1